MQQAEKVKWFSLFSQFLKLFVSNSVRVLHLFIHRFLKKKFIILSRKFPTLHTHTPYSSYLTFCLYFSLSNSHGKHLPRLIGRQWHTIHPDGVPGSPVDSPVFLGVCVHVLLVGLEGGVGHSIFVQWGTLPLCRRPQSH